MKDKLLTDALQHYQKGQALIVKGDRRGASQAYQQALQALHRLAPQKERDKLLARVYLSRFQSGNDKRQQKIHDLRLGYSYAKTSQEPEVRALAEALWQRFLRS